MNEEFVQELLEYVDQLTTVLMDDIDSYKKFLGFLGKYRGEQSIENLMITYGYDRAATDVRSEVEWNASGITVMNKGAPYYDLWKQRTDIAGRDETGRDETGSIPDKYLVRQVFDVRYTNAFVAPIPSFQDNGAFAEMVIASAPCKIVFIEGRLQDEVNGKSGSRFQDEVKGKSGGRLKCIYDSEKKQIKVTNDYRDFDEISQSLLLSYAHYYLDELYLNLFNEKYSGEGSGASKDRSAREYKYKHDQHYAEAISAVYMVCKRYDQKVPDLPQIRRNINISVAVSRFGLQNMDTVFRRMVRKIEMTALNLTG
ncbi:MAG: hypothetical protein K5750_09440 [Eubacterium sp.]|nr:hypothetical protein [Eubacterium sp.]